MFLRRIVGIRYPQKITNIELYKITNQRPWSEKCRLHRLILLGHTCRLPIGAPSKEALKQVLTPVLKLPGGQKTTLIGTIKKDFESVEIDGKRLPKAQTIAQNKKEYSELVNCVTSRNK